MTVETGAAKVRVVVVENHPAFREALIDRLKAADHLDLMGVYNALPAGLAPLEVQQPDVLLVDLSLPSGSGLSLVRLAQRSWGERCVSAILTVTGNDDHLMKAFGAGAKGYVLKCDQPANWLNTVNGLARGLSPLHPKMAQQFLQQLGPLDKDEDRQPRDLLAHVASGYAVEVAAAQVGLTPQAAGRVIRRVYDQFLAPVPELSRRELELLSLLNKGYTFRMSASYMGVGEATIKTHATRAYQKLGAKNLQMALYEARMAGLIA